MTEEEINKRIAELEAQRAEIRRKEREEAEAKKRQEREERADAYQTIEGLIDNYNEKYHGSLVLMERFDAHELLSRYGLM